MREQGHGTIVNIASAAAAAATKLHVSYSPAQAAIISLSRCMNAWLARAGVAVHCLCPDLTPAGGVGRTAATIFATEDGMTMEEWLQRRFLSRLMEPEELGKAIVELTDKPAGDVWLVGPAGREQWSNVLSTPVKADASYIVEQIRSASLGGSVR